MDIKTLITPFLEDSTTGRDKRLAFYKNPMKYLHENAGGLSDADRAVFFTMNRRLIGEKSPKQANKIDLFEFEGHWPEQGIDWLGPLSEDWYDPTTHTFAVAPRMFRAMAAGAGAGAGAAAEGGGGAWGDPGPHGRGFKPSEAMRGETFDLVLVGEGFLDSAKISLEHADWRMPNSGPHVFDVQKAAYGNFRRCYLSCTVTIGDDWPTGSYEITVQNDPGNHETFIRAGHLFRVHG